MLYVAKIQLTQPSLVELGLGLSLAKRERLKIGGRGRLTDRNHSLLKSLILYQALLKYIPHHWGTLWGGELDKEDQAGGQNFLPGFTK